MPKFNFKKMSVADLVAIRSEVQVALSEKIEDERAELQERMDALSALNGGRRSGGKVPVRRGRPPGPAKAGRKGRSKVEPKYRGPGGETWTGRGSAPRWLTGLESQGKKRESFLIRK